MPTVLAVDWVAIGAIATACASIATATAAAFTAYMASATRRMAESSEAQLDFLHRQTRAAETSVEQRERELGATMRPRFRVQRMGGSQVNVTMDSQGFSIHLVNQGPVQASLRQAVLIISPQQIFLEPDPPIPIDPEGSVLIRCDPHEGLAAWITERKEVPVQLDYAGPNDETVTTLFSIKRKTGRPVDRWIISREEREKKGPPRSGAP